MPSLFLIAALLAPQPGQTAVADVRQMLSDARAEIEKYRAAGGKSGVAEHPAVKWQAALWGYRDRYPGSEAAALATAEGIQLLIRAELFDAAHAKVDALAPTDLAWERLAPYLYYEASNRKDFTYLVAKLTPVAAGTGPESVKAAALVALARTYRRQGDMARAIASLEAAGSAAPGSNPAGEATAMLYDIKTLSVGLPAPPFSATARDGRKITVDGLRGSVIVLLFWGST